MAFDNSNSINSKHKDRLFFRLFGSEENKENTLSLYNALNDSCYTDCDAIEFNTLEDALYLSMHNDVSFIISSDQMQLYEHQSTFNPNMPLRSLIYCGELYSKYIRKYDLLIYGKTLQKIPAPKIYIFYNGTNEFEDKIILKLSDAFINNQPGDIELRATMLNINVGHNKQLLEKSKPLCDYSLFISAFRRYNKFKNIDSVEAAKKAINDLPDGAVKNYLTIHQAEVVSMFLAEYNEEHTMQQFYDAGKSEGVAEGKSIGVAEGKSIGLAEGKSIGLAEGKSIGIAEGRLSAFYDAVSQNEMSIDSAARLCNLSTEEFSAGMKQAGYSVGL